MRYTFCYTSSSNFLHKLTKRDFYNLFAKNATALSYQNLLILKLKHLEMKWNPGKSAEVRKLIKFPTKRFLKDLRLTCILSFCPFLIAIS